MAVKLSPIITLSKDQFDNLEKLADYLENQCDPEHFNMSNYFSSPTIKIDELPYFINSESYSKCGTVACAAGYGPIAGIKPTKKEDWYEYIYRNFTNGNELIYWWCFSCVWEMVDNTPAGAAKRINFMIENNVVPIWNENWDELMALYNE